MPVDRDAGGGGECGHEQRVLDAEFAVRALGQMKAAHDLIPYPDRDAEEAGIAGWCAGNPVASGR
jgi:hypothetical protein